jgi:hypothetical protein
MPAPMSAASPWLFSRRTDLLAFGGPALASVLLVVLGLGAGLGAADAPPVVWLLAVVCIDVAHVWSTAYRIYADPVELRRRPLLYLGVPLAAWLAGVGLHLHSAALFWRVLTYVAVFHFVRQQYGWVMLYRRRAGETGRLGLRIDQATIYAATLHPLVVWHASLPRKFHWFLAGDFVPGLPPFAARVSAVLTGLVFLAYLGKSLLEARRGFVAWGKHLLVGSTALCWWLGIVAFDSDYVFTVTNVLIHGVPYFVVVYRFGRARYQGEKSPVAAVFRAGVPAFYGILLLIGFVEEGFWDALVWHDHPQFFGTWSLEPGRVALALVVPLLAMPQAVHYALDAFIWKVKANPVMRSELTLAT